MRKKSARTKQGRKGTATRRTTSRPCTVPFSTVCYDKPLAIIEAMIQQKPSLVNTPFRKHHKQITNTPLLLAIARRNADVVALLLRYGADANASPYTVEAALARQNPSILRLLLDHGLRIDPYHDRLWTLVADRNINMVTLLLDVGANCNLYDAAGLHEWSKGRSLVSKAVENNDLAMVKLLVTRGANVHLGMCRDPFVIDTNETLTSPLTLAMLYRRHDMIETLLKAGCDMYEEDACARARHQGTSCRTQSVAPLYHTLASENLLQWVLRHHTLPMDRLVRGYPLLCVALCINIDRPYLVNILQLLIDHGANPLAKSVHGHTIVDIAQDLGKLDILPFLHKATAKALNEEKLKCLCQRRAMHAQYLKWGLDDTAECFATDTLESNVITEVARMDAHLFFQLSLMF